MSEEMSGTDARIEREKSIVRKLIEVAARRGWHVKAVYNGAEGIPIGTVDQAIEHVFSVGEASVYFQRVDGRSHRVLLVPGVDQDIVTDYSIPAGCEEDIEALHDEVAAYADSIDPRGAGE